MKRASCVLVVNQETNEYLAVSLKRDFTDFNLPGGKVDQNEDYIDGGIRELKEETGLVVKKEDLIHIHTGNDISCNGTGGDFLVKTYYTHSWSGDIKREVGGGIVKWISLKDIAIVTKTWPDYNYTVYQKYLETIEK